LSIVLTTSHCKKVKGMEENGRGYVRWPRSFKNCRAMEEEEEEEEKEHQLLQPV
jgi:hypothetical protein